MAVEDMLRALGVPARVRDALAILPPEVAAAVAAEAWRIVEDEGDPARPAGDEAGAPPPALPAVTCGEWGWIVAEAGGVESLAVIRWRLVRALLRLDAGRLAANARGFLLARSAWETARGGAALASA